MILIDSPVYFARESFMNTNNSVNILKIWNCFRQNTSGRQDSPVMNTLGSLDYWTVCHQKVLLQTCFGVCSKYTKKSTHWCIHHREVEIPPCNHYRGAETHGVFTTGELILPGVFITGESFWTRESLTNIKEHRQSLKYTKKSTPWCIHHRWVGNLWCIHGQGIV